MLELQGEALQVLPCSHKRRFGIEDHAIGSASHEDCHWGTDKGAGNEGGCEEGKSVPQSNAKYVFLSFFLYYSLMLVLRPRV